MARDPDRAEYWYRRAFAGNVISQTYLNHLLEKLEKIRDPAAWERKQQRLAEERAHERQRLAEAGDREAQYQLGILYSGGSDYVEKDLAQAVKWFQKSADQGYADAQFALGLMHEAGIGGISKDIDKAKDLYHKAADQEHYLANQQTCALSENCTLAPKYTPASKSTDEMSPWLLLCFTPWTFALCAAMGG